MPRFRTTRLKPSLLLPVLILIAAGIIILFLHHRHYPSVIPSSSPLTDNTNSNASRTNSNASNQITNQDSNNAGTSGPTNGPPPITPFGNFVSNHRPGGNAPTSEASTCNTSADATCYIEFTNGPTVKKLDPQIADGKGSVLWYWDVKSAGLSSGSWTITAVATLNGQTKAANDSLPLEIQ